MRAKPLLFLIFTGLICHSINAQNLSFGPESGINFSNLNKKNDNQRFDALPGPVNGITARYQMGNWFSLQSGLNLASLYFSESVSYVYYNDFYPTSSSYAGITAPSYSQMQTSKFSFLRIPLLLKFRTPGRVNLEVGGGPYYAWLVNDELRGKDRDVYRNDEGNDNSPKLNDWGWMVESSVNYHINARWNVFASARLSCGKETYFENVEGKMGSTEFSVGVGYAPFKPDNYEFVPDSVGENLTVMPYSGFVISKVRTDDNKKQYRHSFGFSSGVSLKYHVGPNASFFTGAWYERKGYNLDYPGYYVAYYEPSIDESATNMESSVQLDYLTIPFLMDIDFGGKIRNHINFGVYLSVLQNAFAEGMHVSKTTYSNGYRVTKEYFNESLDNWFENTDAGFMAAYRVDIPLWDWASSFLSVNYAIGVKNILNQSQEFQTQYSFLENKEMHNSSIGLQFGLSIPVNKN